MHKIAFVLCRIIMVYRKKLWYYQKEAMEMKNHKLINGRFLQTNKKWSHLKQNQKIWIADVTKKEHEKYVLKHNKLPMRKKKYEIFDEVDEKVQQREIWIPYEELKLHVNKIIDRLNRKSPLFNQEK